MSDYTQNVLFAPKDALTTGDTAKRIKGTEMDAEFSEIATAISSKEDAADKGVASGYASLDASALVPTTQLPAATTSAQGAAELATDAETITGTDAVRTVTPAGLKAVLDQNAGVLTDIAALADPNADVIGFWDDSAGAFVWLTLGTNLSITGTTINATTTATTDAAALTTGVLADARVQASNVTQHQAALSIAESQIADGAVFPRLAANETISGTWTYNSYEIGWKLVPKSATTSGTLTAAEVSKCVPATAGITIDNSVFAAGQAVSIYNDSASAITITQGTGVTLRLAGTTTTGNRTLAARGIATIWFNSASEGICSGGGLS